MASYLSVGINNNNKPDQEFSIQAGLAQLLDKSSKLGSVEERGDSHGFSFILSSREADSFHKTETYLEQVFGANKATQGKNMNQK